MEVEGNLSDKALVDLKIIDRALKGEEKAYADLLNRYRDSVYYVLLKMVNNPSDAEDLTIEAFGKAFLRLSQYTPTHAFSTWLFRIATNNCIDFMRKKSQSPLAFNQDNEDENDYARNVASETPDPEETLIDQEVVMQINDVMKYLKPRYRRIIELRYFNDKSYEEISDELGLPIGTVKARLFRAKTLLHSMITTNKFSSDLRRQ
ncbi:MAG TPA: sigma-70 family RNA polymerase sigma factor [Bacteroidales bacterium]|nr:sigma-70 family RNA polymerase sigma factor [Bacteroidales bacterium]HPT13086.1 sigma-70 family RNA polymerase sigma factor [Bacteroidales bacterium]